MQNLIPTLETKLASWKKGEADPKAEPVVVQDGPATALVDGKGGFGQIVARRGMEVAMAKAAAIGAALALAEEGLRWTVLAPWQAVTAALESRRPHRVDLGGSPFVVAFYDAALSAAVSFQPTETADADRFARDWVLPRTSSPLHRDSSSSWARNSSASNVKPRIPS